MTVDYKLRQGRYEPVLENTEQGTPIPWIRTQLRGILDGAAMQEKAGKVYTLKQCARILGRLMAAPTSEEARVYGNFCFVMILQKDICIRWLNPDRKSC